MIGMNFMNKLSIKTLIIAALALLGICTIALSIYSSNKFKETAINTQTETLSRILEVASLEIIKEIHQTTGDLANDTANTNNFKTIFKNGLSSGDYSEVVETLNQQFFQRYVTGGLLDVASIRVYDKNLNFITQSSQGESDVPRKLNAKIYDKAIARKGPERLKRMGQMWLDGETPYYSVIAPVGGIFLSGYIEAVVKPQHNIYKIKNMLNTPLLVKTINDRPLIKTDNWEDEPVNSLVINYTIMNHNQQPLIKLSTIEPAELLFSEVSKTQLLTIGLTLGILFIFIASIIFVLTRNFFKPLRSMLINMNACAKGDLTVNTHYSGLSDIRSVSNALTELVSGLKEQIGYVVNGTGNVQSMSEQMHDVANRTSDNVQQQLSEITMVATATNEMSATVQEVARSASDASVAAQQAETQSHIGMNTVKDSISSILRLSGEVTNATNVINEVKSSSNEIGSVLDVIKTIAEQTNLLALNAAIEAARAGEQGRGFAVVADEVRTLASRTHESTVEIERMIELLQTSATNAVNVMTKNAELAKETVDCANLSGKAFDEVKNSIDTINQMNEQIATAAEEQSHVAEEINRSIVNINQVSEVSSDAAKETASVSIKLTNEALDLKSHTEKFVV